MATDKQMATLKIVSDAIREHGRSPSVRELTEPLAVTSHQGVSKRLRRLRGSGLIHYVEGEYRAIRLTEAGRRELVFWELYQAIQNDAVFAERVEALWKRQDVSVGV